MYRSTLPLTHRPMRNGSAVEAAHVPAYLALELASQAWTNAVADSSEGLLTATQLVIVNITSNFSRELLVGTADVEVVLKRVGRSSLTVDVAIDQESERAAVATFTLVHVVGGVAHPLSDEQRGSLASLVEDPALQV